MGHSKWQSDCSKKAQHNSSNTATLLWGAASVTSNFSQVPFGSYFSFPVWDTGITSMSYGSTHLTDVNVIVPLDNVLTYELRKALASQSLQTSSSESADSSSLTLFVLLSLMFKTGATHLYLREALWKLTNPKYMPAPVTTVTEKTVWKRLAEWNILLHTVNKAHGYTLSSKNRRKRWLYALSEGTVHIVHWVKQSPCGRNSILPCMYYYWIITLPYPLLLPSKG